MLSLRQERRPFASASLGKATLSLRFFILVLVVLSPAPPVHATNWLVRFFRGRGTNADTVGKAGKGAVQPAKAGLENANAMNKIIGSTPNVNQVSTRATSSSGMNTLPNDVPGRPATAATTGASAAATDAAAETAGAVRNVDPKKVRPASASADAILSSRTSPRAPLEEVKQQPLAPPTDALSGATTDVPSAALSTNAAGAAGAAAAGAAAAGAAGVVKGADDVLKGGDDVLKGADDVLKGGDDVLKGGDDVGAAAAGVKGVDDVGADTAANAVKKENAVIKWFKGGDERLVKKHWMDFRNALRTDSPREWGNRVVNFLKNHKYDIMTGGFMTFGAGLYTFLHKKENEDAVKNATYHEQVKFKETAQVLMNTFAVLIQQYYQVGSTPGKEDGVGNDVAATTEKEDDNTFINDEDVSNLNFQDPSSAM